MTRVVFVDLFEVAILISASFLVNYVTADAKTNWAEGVAMVVFYFMIVSIHIFTFAVLTNIFIRLLVHGSTRDSQSSCFCLSVQASRKLLRGLL